MNSSSMGIPPDQFRRYQEAIAAGHSSLEATRIALQAAPATRELGGATSSSARGSGLSGRQMDSMIASCRRGFTDEQIAEWKAQQLVEARRRQSSGQNMTQTQALLLREATAALPPAAVEIPADVLELAAQGRAMMAAASHTDGDAWVQRAMQAQARRDASTASTTRTARTTPTGEVRLDGRPGAQRISR